LEVGEAFLPLSNLVISNSSVQFNEIIDMSKNRIILICFFLILVTWVFN